MRQKDSMYKKHIKRPVDFIVSLTMLIILSPLLLVVAVLVKNKLGSPILFKQNRPGLNEKIFTMYKFRTMTEQRDEYGELLPDHIRLTRFGKFLRSTSIDELPELLNILKGDMSFIGPRPLLVEYLKYYNDEQRKRHNVRPGLSGLAQVNGRNSLSWEEKFELDVKYVNNISFLEDVKILFLTIKKVFVKEGINFDNTKKNNRFQGTSNNPK
ncbi:sugar transferase [Psychrobacillus sp. FSL W7-1457]|uniref:sugar transferase n=1 Tax=Psychrobacillus sp. FSL W7-1457 TaxID=2954547 RepID=UPI00315A1E1E